MYIKGYENVSNCHYSGKVINKGNPRRVNYYYKKTKCKNYVPSKEEEEEKNEENLFERIFNFIKDIIKEMI